MSEPTRSEAAAPSQPSAPPEWTTQVTDRIVGVVDSVKAKTTLKVVGIVRIVVYGLVAAVAGLLGLLLLLLTVLRLWDNYAPIHPLGRRVWLAYVVLGGLFFLGGLLMWRLRTKQQEVS
jgi:hypothetical protein